MTRLKSLGDTGYSLYQGTIDIPCKDNVNFVMRTYDIIGHDGVDGDVELLFQDWGQDWTWGIPS
jgi:hypothetical protein